MDPIRPSPAADLLSLLRSAGASRTTAAGSAAEEPGTPTPAALPAQTSIREDLARLVQDVDVDDEALLRRIRPLLLKRILAETLGRDGQEGELAVLVASVDKAFDQDERLRSAFREAVLVLKSKV
jgi:hypothetical protein